VDGSQGNQKKISQELERYIVHGAKIEPPFELIVERLCKKYGWKPDDVLKMNMEWVNVFLDIMEMDNRREWKERKRAQIRKERQKNG
jgi:hypothetical protein